MKYPPPHHQDSDRQHLLDVIKEYPLATLISVNENVPYITHLPLIFRETDGKLIGHIDIYNPQTDLLQHEKEVAVIFSGPQCYISPTVYSTTQLPTWNYIKVHLKGKVTRIDSSEALKNSIIKMTEFLESPNQDYVLEPDNPRMLGALDYIKMFEISITEWEGKFKLSQDKKKIDRDLAKEAMIEANRKSVKDLLDKFI